MSSFFTKLIETPSEKIDDDYVNRMRILFFPIHVSSPTIFINEI